MITAKLKLEGVNFNHMKVYRIYKKLELNLRKNKKSRRLPVRAKILDIATRQSNLVNGFYEWKN